MFFMRKRFIYFVLLVLLAGVLSACKNDALPTVTASSETQKLLPGAAAALKPLSIETQTWQEAYAELLQELSGKEFFYVCDIDGDGIPELLIGGPSADTDKYAHYDVYTYRSYKIERLGEVSTLSSDGYLWIDNNGGILGYSYGAGSGGTYRYYIDNGVLCSDGEVHGYYYDSDGNQINWFRGFDESEIIITEEMEDEYQRILNSQIELERYNITESNIAKVIYGEESQATTMTTEVIIDETTKDVDASEYILPESDGRLYTRKELCELSDSDLRLARNEIFARHGRIFTANDLQRYFADKSWYTPQYTSEEFEQKGDTIFNEFEKANRDLLVSMEQQRSAEDIFSGLTFYADIVFHITSYTVEGDTIKLTGTLCDSGFATKEYLMSLKPGDETSYGTVTEVHPDGLIITQLESDTFYLSSDGMSAIWPGGGESIIYRGVKANVTLIYDTKTQFIPTMITEDKEFLQLLINTCYGGSNPNWHVHLIQTTGSHIDIVEDLGYNYVG